MYRNLATLFLCISTVVAAPQNSNITYVKRQAVPPNPQPELKQNKTVRESKIQNLPLTIPGVFNDENKESTKNPITDAHIELANDPNNYTRIYNYSDRIYSSKPKPKKINKNNVTDNTVAIVEEIKETGINSSDILPAESAKIDTVVISENSTPKLEVTTTDSAELVTESYEEELTRNSELEEITTAKALVVSLAPKLAHYGKSISESFSQNIISYSGKRRFRSRCKCEKIWNCAKLQISVPRCPEEYFLCCA